MLLDWLGELAQRRPLGPMPTPTVRREAPTEAARGTGLDERLWAASDADAVAESLHARQSTRCAGGGTRTLKLYRAREPKSRMFANFITPARPAILSPDEESVGAAAYVELQHQERFMRSAEEFEAVQAPHRNLTERLRDHVPDRHTAKDCVGVA